LKNEQEGGWAHTVFSTHYRSLSKN